MQLDLISVGSIRKAHKKDGTVLVLDIDTELFNRIDEIFLDDGKTSPIPMKIESVRPVHNGILLKFADTNSRDEAEELTGKTLSVPKKSLSPLKEWTYYRFQLIGLTVKTVTNQVVGEITEILETGANDVYIVRGEADKDILIPAIRSIVKSIDLDAGLIIIDPLENMLD